MQQAGIHLYHSLKMKLLNVSEKGLKKTFSSKKVLFSLIFLLLLPLVLASTVTVDKETYSLDEPVTISVAGCLGSSILTLLNPSGQAVFSDQGNNDWQTIYHTSSDPSLGEYTINGSCGEESFFTNFNVAEITPLAGEEPPEEEAPSAGGRGAAPRCTSEWSCSYWSICGIDLKQARACYDQKCGLPPKTETRDCLSCDESWVCSLWSGCVAGKQTRKCYDERHCGTNIKKPVLQRDCNVPVTGPAPARIISVPPERFTIPPETGLPELSFWEKYKLWIIAVPAILVLLTLAVLLFLHIYRPPKEAANISELKDWLKKALAQGASKDKIKEIIRQQTNWSDKELDQAFKELEREKQPK